MYLKYSCLATYHAIIIIIIIIIYPFNVLSISLHGIYQMPHSKYLQMYMHAIRSLKSSVV
jgi:hypothetical protein